jgi:hypothetical protein
MNQVLLVQDQNLVQQPMQKNILIVTQLPIKAVLYSQKTTNASRSKLLNGLH